MTDQPLDIFDLLERFRGQLKASDAAALRRLVDGYGLLYRRLQGQIDALLQEIAGMDKPSPAKVARLVMQRTTRVFLVGEGALHFALAHGFRSRTPC